MFIKSFSVETVYEAEGSLILVKLLRNWRVAFPQIWAGDTRYSSWWSLIYLVRNKDLSNSSMYEWLRDLTNGTCIAFLQFSRRSQVFSFTVQADLRPKTLLKLLICFQETARVRKNILDKQYLSLLPSVKYYSGVFLREGWKQDINTLDGWGTSGSVLF